MRSSGKVSEKKRKKLPGHFHTKFIPPFATALYFPFWPKWLPLRVRWRTAQLPAEPHVFSCLGTPQRELLDAALVGLMTENVVEVGSKRETVTRKSLGDLVHGYWIGDEVINGFLVVLQDWSVKHASSPRAGQLSTPSICFPTFWYTRLTAGSEGYNFDNVVRWGRKTDVFSCRNLVIPINFQDYHWALVNVQIASRKIEYFDSFKNGRKERASAVLDVVEKFLLDEEARRHPTSKHRHWAKRVPRVPFQEDKSSCGVYICYFADHLIRNARRPIQFQRKDVAKVRTGIACSLLHHKHVPQLSTFQRINE